MINWVNPDDEVFVSQDNAIDIALDNLECIPAAVGQWLSEACDVVDTDRMVHNPFRLAYLPNPTPAQALAVLFGGTDADSLKALHRLREHYREAVADDAKAIGREAWAKQCLEEQQIINMGREYE